MAYRVDLSLSTDEILRGLINFDNNTNFTGKELTFNPIGAVSVGLEEYYEKRRTSKVSARYRGRVVGERTYYYNRIEFETLLGGLGIRVPWKHHTQTYELLPYIREQLGINLTEDDVVNNPIDPDALIEHVEIFRRNITYTGKIVVVFDGHPDSMTGRIPVRSLSGFSADSIEIPLDDYWKDNPPGSTSRPVGSIFETTDGDFTPDGVFAGVWVRESIEVVDGLTMHYYNLPLRYVMDQHTPPPRLDSIYRFVEPYKESKYNEGFAVPTTEGWTITDENSPFYNATVPYGPKGQYVLLYRTEEPVMVGKPLYRWIRTK